MTRRRDLAALAVALVVSLFGTVGLTVPLGAQRRRPPVRRSS